jgi:hypothetical protein
MPLRRARVFAPEEVELNDLEEHQQGEDPVISPSGALSN